MTLQRTSQALALLNGRDYVLPDDVKFLAPYVLRHRLIPAAGHSAQGIVEQLLGAIAIP